MNLILKLLLYRQLNQFDCTDATVQATKSIRLYRCYCTGNLINFIVHIILYRQLNQFDFATATV